MTKRDRVIERAAEHDVDDGQEPDVIFVERQFPIVLRVPLIMGLVIILVGLVPWSIATANAYSWQPLTIKWLLAWSLVLLVYWAYHFSSWYFTVLILTEEELTMIKQKGPFRRTVESLTLNNIQSVNYHIPGMQAAIFHYGDIEIQTMSGSGHMKIKTLYKPARLQAEILEATQEYSSTDQD